MADSKVNRDNYIVVQGWMLTDLKLKGNELIIYACIYGFSQAEGQTFTGSLQYLADWTNSTKQGVLKALKSLVEKQYIVKKENYINGVKFCEYYATKFNTILNNVEDSMQQSLTPPIKQSLTNKIDLNKQDITNNNIVSGRAKRFTPPTVEEVAAYCAERKSTVDAQRFVDYYESNGWKVGRNRMKDWKAAVRSWERNNFTSGKTYGAAGVEIKKPEYDDLAGIL